VHERGVVHRDVKPSNVLFVDADDHTSVKLADFGIARLADSARLTDAGLIVGSAHYLSPEQAKGEDVGPPSDVYSLGLVLLECLTGAPVFPGAGIEPVVARLHRDPQVPDDVDPALGRLLTAMTSREPAQRPTAHQVATALGRAQSTQPPPRLPVAAVNELGGPTEPLLAGAVHAGHGGRVHRWAWVAAAFAAILVALAGSAALLADTPSRGVTTTDLPSSTASPDATPVSPAPTTTPPAEPAVQPAGAPDDTSAEDNGNGNSNEKGNGKSKGNGNGKGKG
jgi:eukaryotic-like serine/threonine-protein kinase